MSTPPTSGWRAALMHDVSAAFGAGDLATASARAKAADPAMIVAAADAAIAARRWEEAAWLLAQLAAPASGASIKLCLCRNLSAIRKHRPAIYDLLVSLPSNPNVGLGAAVTGHPTIVVRRPSGTGISLSPQNHPIAGLATAMKMLEPVLASGHAMALCGVGDGYVLHQIAHKPPTLFMDMQQPVFVLEPSAHVLLTALMIHDYTGTDGPIEQQRFQWFAGSDWAAALRAVAAADLMLRLPVASIALGLEAESIQQQLNAINTERNDRDHQLRQSVEAHYASIAPGDIAGLFGDQPSRRPRVLLLTTRFSTVLQYATTDTAAAFEQAGWETQTLIEPQRYHRVLSTAVRETLARFKPDLVFQIDHLRYEHGTLFPPNLPFVCWIQDHLTNLRSAAAGFSISPTDFVLSDSPWIYVESHNYPRRQIIPLAKLARPASCPSRIEPPIDEMIFVSNASHVPAELIERRIAGYQGSDGGRALLEEACRWLVSVYDASGSVSAFIDVRDHLLKLLNQSGNAIDTRELDELAAWLTHPLNDALYRQQTLQWAIEALADTGLNLAVYGRGWENHPRFARFARGLIGGAALDERVRRARFNLQVVPYGCLHQRLLDGLAAGGLFLIRAHVTDTVPSALLDFLIAHCDASATNTATARASIPASLRPQLDSLLLACRPAIATRDEDDPVTAVRQWHESGMLIPGRPILSHFDRVSFTDAAGFRARVAELLADPSAARAIREAQQREVNERFSYLGAIQRICREIGQKLGEAAAPADDLLNIRFMEAA